MAGEQTQGIVVDAGLTPEGEAMLDDPNSQFLLILGAIAFVVGRFVIGPRDPNKPRKWYDWRRIS